MILRRLDDSLRFLQSLIDLNAPNQDQINNLRLILSTLQVFLACGEKWSIKNESLQVCLTHIDTVVENSDRNLQVQQHGESDLSESSLLIPDILERMKVLELNIKKVYYILSSTTRFMTPMTDTDIADLIDSLMENMKDVPIGSKNDLNVALKDEIKFLEEKLRFFSNFLRFKAKCCIEYKIFMNLVTHSEAMVDNVACFLYLCLINN
ncbi:hypothetical protein M9H77_09136 [Catharanthus roseus]|uniref:Uncharacterized protein n=1 Tax=Catharanthus roseus TaxID=4058 RepID=A0ACC0BZX4_CATRO|nr:hypothetical protein M9H77_09136 [Catharanthus roseus]